MTLYTASLNIAVSVLIFWLLIVSNLGVAAAAPLRPDYPEVICKDGAFKQHDMQGVYENPAMQVIVAPCGGVQVRWTNAYGEHVVVYFSEARIQTGGVVVGGYTPDPEIGAYLDSVPYAAIQPMEPGYIRLTSMTQDGHFVQSYRLQKIT